MKPVVPVVPFRLVKPPAPDAAEVPRLKPPLAGAAIAPVAEKLKPDAVEAAAPVPTPGVGVKLKPLVAPVGAIGVVEKLKLMGTAALVPWLVQCEGARKPMRK